CALRGPVGFLLPSSGLARKSARESVLARASGPLAARLREPQRPLVLRRLSLSFPGFSPRRWRATSQLSDATKHVGKGHGRATGNEIPIRLVQLGLCRGVVLERIAAAPCRGRGGGCGGVG